MVGPTPSLGRKKRKIRGWSISVQLGNSRKVNNKNGGGRKDI